MSKVTIISIMIILTSLAIYEYNRMEELTDSQIEENHEAQLLNELNR